MEPAKTPAKPQSVVSLADATSQNVDEKPYSSFSRRQKVFITSLTAFAAVFSPLSSFIYYPAIHALARDLDISIEQANLGVTTYMIVAGIVPALIANAADRSGRRKVYVVALIVYFAANVGLALQRNYAALLCLRMLQSAGGAGVISLAYGVLADIVPRAERGKYAGYMNLGPNVAPSLGPVLGGVLAHEAGWPWNFWFLSILAAVALVIIFLYLPETARTVVGDGHLPAQQLTLTPLWAQRSKRQIESASDTTTQASKPPYRFPNPLASLKVLGRRDSAIVISVSGTFYMVYCSVQTTLSSLFISIYSLNELEAGLVYLPFGFGCVVGTLASGKLMQRDFRNTARSYDMSLAAAHDLPSFPIEIARYRTTRWAVLLTVVAFVGYGWSLAAKTSMAVPLIMQAFLGATTTVIFNTCGTLLTDLNHKAPATAQAAQNLIKCSLAAGGTAVIQLLLNAIGAGLTFTLVGVICLCATPAIYVQMRYGVAWRLKRFDATERPGLK